MPTLKKRHLENAGTVGYYIDAINSNNNYINTKYDRKDVKHNR